MDQFEFWITIAGIFSGLLGLTLKMCLKSKCEDVNCCYGLFNVHRNIKAEEDIELQRPKSTDSQI